MCADNCMRVGWRRRVQKKKLWEAVQPLLKTDGAKVATFKGRAMTTSAGPVTAATLTNASIA